MASRDFGVCMGPVGYEQLADMLVRRSDGTVRWYCSTCGAAGSTREPVRGGRVEHLAPRYGDHP